jgi:phytoene dehydrogenase-like protein
MLPVVGEYDVVVAGGGMAGVAAAVAAARRGARVGLVEKQSALGGLATLGNVTIWLPLCDGMGRQVVGGLGEELLRLSVADLRRDYPAARFRRPPACWEEGGNAEERRHRRFKCEFNPSSYMLALEKLITDEDVHLLYDTRVCAVLRDGEHVTHLVIENKSGRGAVACKVVVDATGDADVCFLAGEETESLDSDSAAGWFYTLTDGELRLHQHSKNYCPMATREGGEGPFFRGDDGAQVTAQILATRSWRHDA